MPTTAEISQSATEQRERIRIWLRTFMEDGKPKMAAKEVLFGVWPKKKARGEPFKSALNLKGIACGGVAR